MRVQDQSVRNPVDAIIIDGLKLMRAFFKIADATDRHRVIELAAALARTSSPPIEPR